MSELYPLYQFISNKDHRGTYSYMIWKEKTSDHSLCKKVLLK